MGNNEIFHHDLLGLNFKKCVKLQKQYWYPKLFLLIHRKCKSTFFYFHFYHGRILKNSLVYSEIMYLLYICIYLVFESPQALYLTPRVYWLDNRVMEQCHTTYIKSGTECRLFKGYIKELTVSFNNYLTIMY